MYALYTYLILGKLATSFPFLLYSTMLNKNTLGVKKCEANQKQKNTHVRPKTLISAEVKKLPIKNLYNYLNDMQQFIAYFHNYDWLCHMATYVYIWYRLALSPGHLYIWYEKVAK